MKKLKDFKIPSWVIILIIFCIYGAVLFEQYQYTKIEQSDLTQRQEVFSSYTLAKGYDRIFCADGDQYIIDKILSDTDVVISLKKGDVLLLSVKEDNEIIELNVNGQQIFSLDDCHEIYKQHVKTSCIILGSIALVIVVVGIFLKIYFNRDVVDIATTSGGCFGSDIDLETYRYVKNSMIKTRGGYYCDFLSYTKNARLTESALKGVIDFICQDEFVLVFDDNEPNMAFAFYKRDEKFYFETLFKEKNQPFKISSTLFWFEPYNAQVTQDEQIAFSRALEYYLLTNGDILQMR